MQHLRIGSVINIVSGNGSVLAANLTVSNITDAYIELEHPDSALVEVKVWSLLGGHIELVTD